MKIIYFSENLDLLDEWIKREDIKDVVQIDDEETLLKNLDDDVLIVADYDSVAHSINGLISSNHVPDKLIVLEKIPEIATGKMLISKGIKAYGNSRMLKLHYQQMRDSVADGKVWTYPELTASLSKVKDKNIISDDAKKLLEHRLTAKELQIIDGVLDGLTNSAIAEKFGITTRTVKAHMTSIFAKLHVNDRVSLILLLLPIA